MEAAVPLEPTALNNNQPSLIVFLADTITGTGLLRKKPQAAARQGRR